LECGENRRFGIFVFSGRHLPLAGQLYRVVEGDLFAVQPGPDDDARPWRTGADGVADGMEV
jgi:hypothetical protein